MPDLNPREWAAIVPLIVMMVWMGVYSQSFLPPVGKVNARVLEQTKVNVPFRVQDRASRVHRGGRQCPLIRCSTRGDAHPLPARDHPDHHAARC